MSAEDIPVTPQSASLRDRYSRFFVDHEVAWELLMAALSIAFVVVGLVSETVPERDAGPYIAVEIALTMFFTFEFVTRIWAARDRRVYLRGHWIDLLALIPTIRGFRLIRLVRLLRLVRAFAGVYRALARLERFASNRTLVLLFMAWLTVAIICSATFYFAENGTNELIKTPFDAFWWGITTLSTVGYGDIYPKTAEGRLAATALMILGITLWAAITGTITASLLLEKSTGDGAPATIPDQIRQFAELLQDGHITREEFETKKAQLLALPWTDHPQG